MHTGTKKRGHAWDSFKYVKKMFEVMGHDQSKRNPRQIELATLGGGCFWCTEAVFGEIKGVIRVEPGYSGGQSANPTYKLVSTGTTGHAEVVQITMHACNKVLLASKFSKKTRELARYVQERGNKVGLDRIDKALFILPFIKVVDMVSTSIP